MINTTEITSKGEILHVEEFLIDIKHLEGKKAINLTIRDNDQEPMMCLDFSAIKKLDIENGEIKTIELMAEYDRKSNYVVIR